MTSRIRYQSAEAEALSTRPDFRRSSPQLLRDDWRHAVRTLRYRGACVVCNVRTYGFDDGENDPRGVLGDHAASALTFTDDGQDIDTDGIDPASFADVPACFLCMNDEPRYRLAYSLARAAWSRRSRDLRQRLAEMIADAAEGDPGELDEPTLCWCGHGYTGHDPAHA